MSRLSDLGTRVRGWLIGGSGGAEYRSGGPIPVDLIPDRPRAGSSVSVTRDTAMRHSSVWAALRLRANLVSTLPIECYRDVSGIEVSVPTPPVLRAPGGGDCGPLEWMYSTQVDLDRVGNAVGLVTARSGNGLPAVIELQPLDDVTVRAAGRRVIKYRIGGKEYDPSEVWHERQYTLSGMAVGLSPIAYAAWSLAGYLSAQEFVADWFMDGQLPAARLKSNMLKTISPRQAEAIKARYRAAVKNRELFIHGSAWDFELIKAAEAQPQFVEAMQYGATDVARFFDVPADLIEASHQGASLTYANIGQRNLQLLILHLGPAIRRREDALSRLLPAPWRVRLCTDDLLRMDPQTLASVIKTEIDSRTLTPDEARAMRNRPPLTPDDLAQFTQLFGSATRNTSAAEVIQKAYLGVGKVLTSDEARELANQAGAGLTVPGPDFTGVAP